VAQASCRSHRPPRPSLATSTATATYSSDFWSNQQGYDIRNNTLSIEARPLNLLGSRVYDGSTLFQASDIALGNLVGAETLALSGSGSVANADASLTLQNLSNTGGLAIANGTNGGLASNYSLFAIGSTSQATIGQRVLDLTGGQIYDGSTLVAAGGLSLGNLVAGQTLNLSGLAQLLDSKNVGMHTPVDTSGLTLANAAGGGKASNYTLNGGSSLIDISARQLNVSTTGVDNIYDGNTNAVVTYSSDKIAGDLLDFSNTSSTFASKNVGSREIAVSGISLSGGDAGNYFLASTASSTSAAISPKSLVATAANDSKSFDGRPYSGGNGVSYAGFVAGDSAADIGGSPSYVGSSQGAYLTGRYDITPAGLTSLSGNYVLGYQLPIGSSGLRVGAAYFSVHYKLAREFAALLADGSAHSTSVYASYPFIRSQLANLNGTVSYENKKTVDNVASTATITGKTLKTTSLGLSGSLQDGLGGGGLSSLDLSLVTGKLDIESPSALALDAASARSNGSYEKFTWGASRLQQLGVWAADRFRKWETARFAARAVLQQS
jgi:hypothetical protein